jgi:hypothetical protein
MKILNSNLDVCYKERSDVYNFSEIQHKFYVTYQSGAKFLSAPHLWNLTELHLVVLFIIMYHSNWNVNIK